MQQLAAWRTETYRFFKGTACCIRLVMDFQVASTFSNTVMQKLLPQNLTQDENWYFTVTIKNTGFFEGEEVVQLLFVVKPAMHERNPI
ncbi:MAG: hypothetical protein MZV63_37990 [Marinilabiliales bacterium]|nr:hypothetical protein [Marinilabiliales bacterium]